MAVTNLSPDVLCCCHSNYHICSFTHLKNCFMYLQN